MNQQKSLTEGRVVPTLLKFAFPFLLSSLLQALYGAADLFVVGQYSNSAGVAAVSIGSQVMQTITGIILGLTTGGTVLIGQYLGAKKEKDVAQTVGTIACIFAAIAAVLTLVMVLLTNQMTAWMHTPAEAVLYTRQYILICSCGIPFIIGYNALSGILRGLGNSKTPLYFILAACIINIVVDFVLVGGFHMGAAGAAIATVAAQGISFILAVLYLLKTGFSFPFSRKDFRFDRVKIGRIFKLGLPIALQEALINVSFLLITAIINSMGLIESASVGVVEKLIVFTMLPTTSFASAVAAMTAQNIGAGKAERAKKCMYTGIVCSLVFGVACYMVALIRPTALTSIFSADPAVIEVSAMYLKSYSLDCVLVCFIFCMNSFFSGCGHSMFPMVHSVIATFLIRIPVSFVLSRTAGITLFELGFAAPAATMVSIILCVIYFKSGKWNDNKSSKAQDEMSADRETIIQH